MENEKKDSGLTPETIAALRAVIYGADTPVDTTDKTAPAASQAENGWKSRKLWVALVSLVGMVAQLPLEKRLSPQELVAFACVAVAYLVMQGLVDIAKVRANGQGPAA